MRQLQVDIISDFKDEARGVLEDYSSDISSSEIEKNDDDFIEFSVTVDQDKIDEISEELKDLEVKSGNLSIRVLDQESLIEKGVKTRGPSASILSSQEVYSKAQQASTFNNAQWGMTGLSGALAGIGLSTGNIIVLLGSILLAPVLHPLAALAVSIRIGDKKLAMKSAETSSKSILSIFLFSIPIFLLMGEAQLDVLIQGAELVVLSSIVGSAAMLTFISEYREEMAGAALAVAIVPPTAIIGNSVAGLNPLQTLHGSQVLLANVLTVLISGYGILAISGAKPLTEYKVKDAKKLNILVLVMILVLLVLIFYTL